MSEALTQAHDCAGFAARDLQAALKTATAVEALVILPLISQAFALQGGIKALQGAMSEAHHAAR